MKTNEDVIMEDESLMECLKEIKRINEKNFRNFEHLLGNTMCMLSHFTNVQIAS